MKKLIILPLIIGIAFATPKKKLNDCEQRYDSLLHYVANDSVYFAYKEVKAKTRHEVKGEVKKVKYVEKTKRKLIKADKQVDISTNKNETKRSTPFNIRKTIIKSSWALMVGSIVIVVLIVGLMLLFSSRLGTIIKSFFNR